jgi:signal transduction histidine kinase
MFQVDLLTLQPERRDMVSGSQSLTAGARLMRATRTPLARWLMVALVLATVFFAARTWLRWQHAHSVVPDRAYPLQAGNSRDWTAYGGSWQVMDGAVQSNSFERGAKFVAGSYPWADYTMTSDMWFEGPAADMGVVIRSNDEAEGVDAYRGYFVGIRSLDGTLVMGRANYSWTEVLPVSIPGGVHPFNWYRLRVSAYGCDVAASVINLTTQQTASIAFKEHFCIKSGRFGIRTLNANARWRNIRVEPATSADLQKLEQQAGFIQHPVVANGPPWWTPWHVGMLFAGVLVMALLTQLSYFRIQNWKVQTITRERERLAHDIHDTMAQGFAGVGYQIQGIRSSIVRGDRLDARHIADQLSVAYQLVRSCHEEASRTIAMLGSASPRIQQNLLGALAETADKTAGDKIKTIAELRGNPTPLNLRLADALLHIGQEAIANALGHGNPTVLKITLIYQDGSVELVVEDDGSGFDYSPESAGFGILGMQKRARNVGSVLNIASASTRGTTVRVKASLQQVGLRQRAFTLLRNRLNRLVSAAGTR